MPRGNDATAVAAENRKRFGDYQDCESLIRSQAALVNPALQRTLQIPRDDSKTDEIKKDLDAVAAKFNLGEGESVVDASVRGNAIVAVIEGTDNR